MRIKWESYVKSFWKLLPRPLQWLGFFFSKVQFNFPVMIYKAPGNQGIAYFATSFPMAPYINSYSLTTPNRCHSVHLWEDHFCMHYIHKSFLLNTSAWWSMAQTKSTPDSTQPCHELSNVLGNRDSFYNFRSRKYNVRYVFPGYFGFLSIKLIDDFHDSNLCLSGSNVLSLLTD